MKVLVVEDYPINQELIKEFLLYLGCEVTLADGGQQALELYKQESFDIIFMDVQMPEMDGYEATQRLRLLEGEKRRTPIIALTASAVEGDKEKCLEAGMDDYISKPFQISELEEMINRWKKQKSPTY